MKRGMTQKEAHEYAAQHGIPITTERREGWRIRFNVGAHVLSRYSDSREWSIDFGCVLYTRGEAIRQAVDRILGARAAGKPESEGWK